MKNFMYISGGNIIRQLTTFLAQLFIAKNLGSAAFGELTYAFSIYFILAGLGDFGVRFYSWKSVLAESVEQKQNAAVRFLLYRTLLTILFIIPVNAIIWSAAEGSLALLLHLYTITIVFNQIAYDWYFLSLNKLRQLFIFNSLSGIIYFVTVVTLVSDSGDIVLVPILLALSYAVPAAALVGKQMFSMSKDLLMPGSILASIGNAVRLPFRGYKYLLYDLLKRLYYFFIFIVAGLYFDNSLLGQFRAAHLLYTFIASLAMFLGMSYFNRVSEDVKTRGQTRHIADGVGIMFLIMLPISVAGQDVVPSLAGWFFGEEYVAIDSVLSILLLGLLLPACGNFIREVTISTHYSNIAPWSLLATIATISIALVIYHPAELTYLGLILLLGEFVGLFVLFQFLPLKLLPKRWVYIGSVAVGFAVILKIVFYAMSFITARIYEGAAYMTAAYLLIAGCLYLTYIIWIQKRYRIIVSAGKGHDH